MLATYDHIGVIFDCDGTLLDSMHAWRDVEAELARRCRGELSKAQKDELVTFTIPETGAFFHEYFGLGDDGAHVVRMVDELMLDYYRHRVRERPGALAFVRDLVARGVHVSVASSSPQLYLQAGLASTGFSPYLDAIVSVDDVGVSKREPTVYDRAREIMGTPLESTWGFEDASYAVRTLRSAGYLSVGIYDCDAAGTWEDITALADIAVRGFDEIDVETLVLHQRV